MGIAGVRINHSLNGVDSKEVMVFLGASYFRAIGEGQVYGLSGRGLAVDTGLSSGDIIKAKCKRPQRDAPQH